MLSGALTGLIVAWILSLFGFDVMTIDAAKEFGYSITINTYYVIFIVIGAIGGALKGDD
ncbi:putative membrane protein (plasmid) [Clostridium baratii str. Sullivan]|uniref:Putative membrane protein n=1 Tax=Clostridium baratii str. Sullivan TaxID=1415775 RepID=A0A0A7G322_9CLOT|nr:hypothetical protein [Clostridium baratii]AIY85410.1 putative membrane protein [Clostridium baratii str. Sullivan]